MGETVVETVELLAMQDRLEPVPLGQQPRWRHAPNGVYLARRYLADTMHDVYLIRQPGDPPFGLVLRYGDKPPCCVNLMDSHKALARLARRPLLRKAFCIVIERWEAGDPDPLIQEAGPLFTLYLLGACNG